MEHENNLFLHNLGIFFFMFSFSLSNLPSLPALTPGGGGGGQTRKMVRQMGIEATEKSKAGRGRECWAEAAALSGWSGEASL